MTWTMKRVVSLFGLMAAAFMAFGCKKESAEPTPAASVAQPVAPAPVATIAPDLREEPAAAPAEPEPEPTVGQPAPGAAPAKEGATATQAAPAASEAPKPSVPSGYTAIQRCCNALAAAAKKEGRTKNQYTAASAVCTGLAQKVKTGAATAAGAKTTLRAQLQGVPMPGGC
jgi:hypothetical protein